MCKEATHLDVKVYKFFHLGHKPLTITFRFGNQEAEKLDLFWGPQT